MADFPTIEFESLVREFLANKKSWDDVHRFVIDAEWTNAAEIHGRGSDVLEELRTAFLADSKDDPQFLLSRTEVGALFEKFQANRPKPS
jgi:hypothetical protein